jgi:hypothetical protein
VTAQHHAHLTPGPPGPWGQVKLLVGGFILYDFIAFHTQYQKIDPNIF